MTCAHRRASCPECGAWVGGLLVAPEDLEDVPLSKAHPGCPEGTPDAITETLPDLPVILTDEAYHCARGYVRMLEARGETRSPRSEQGGLLCQLDRAIAIYERQTRTLPEG